MSDEEIDRIRARECDETAKRFQQYPPEIREIILYEIDKSNEAMHPLCNDLMSLAAEASSLYDYTKRVEIVAEIIVGKERIRYLDRVVTISSEDRDE